MASSGPHDGLCNAHRCYCIVSVNIVVLFLCLTTVHPSSSCGAVCCCSSSSSMAMSPQERLSCSSGSFIDKFLNLVKVFQVAGRLLIWSLFIVVFCKTVSLESYVQWGCFFLLDECLIDEVDIHLIVGGDVVNVDDHVAYAETGVPCDGWCLYIYNGQYALFNF